MEDHLWVYFGDYLRYSSPKSLDQNSLIFQTYFIYTLLAYHLSVVLVVSPDFSLTVSGSCSSYTLCRGGSVGLAIQRSPVQVPQSLLPRFVSVVLSSKFKF